MYTVADGVLDTIDDGSLTRNRVVYCIRLVIVAFSQRGTITCVMGPPGLRLEILLLKQPLHSVKMCTEAMLSITSARRIAANERSTYE
jgi:hypothetical protein